MIPRSQRANGDAAIQRRDIVTGRSIEASTSTWHAQRSDIALAGEYSFTRRLALFANLRNVNDPSDDVKIHGPTTPACAQFRPPAELGSP